MNRRSFLEALAGLGAGLVLPEPARVRAYSFLPGDRFGPSVHDFEFGDLVALDEHGRLVKATHERPILGQAVLVTNQVDAWRNGVYHFADVQLKIDGQVFHGVKSISYEDS